MGDATRVLVGASGTIKAAVTGTALPTTASATPNAAFTDRGFVSEEGVVQTIGADSTEIKAWGGTIVRKVQSSHDVTYQFTYLETNPSTQADYYGVANFDDALNVSKIKATNTTRQEWIIDVLDGTNKVRIVIPDGEVSERGDITYATEEAIAYPITITCYPDTSDVKAYIYHANPGIS